MLQLQALVILLDLSFQRSRISDGIVQLPSDRLASPLLGDALLTLTSPATPFSDIYMQFKKNINALRAVAVIAVVCFHFKLAGFAGGFIGVDIFFVISGFLMTAIIITGLQSGSFSLATFYAARARRIIPALVVLCIVMSVFGFFVLPISDYRKLALEIGKSLLFISNISLAAKGGYFDAPAHENWMLHTWSLSLEWQFYIIYPAFLTLLAKHFTFGRMRMVILAAFLLSFLASSFFSDRNPSLSFYLLPTRAWELLLGGLVFLFPWQPGRRISIFLESSGLIGISLCVIFLNGTIAWPGVTAALPVLCAAFVLYGRDSSPFNNNHPLQFLGTISYSVYLWHWPLAVFLFICGFSHNGLAIFAAIGCSVLLGAVSFFFVERRKGPVAPARRVLWRYGALTSLTIVGGFVAVEVARSFPPLRLMLAAPKQPEYASAFYKQECYPNAYGAADCKIGEGPVAAILFGDSHAQSTAAALQLGNRDAALMWARGGCPLLLAYDMRDRKQRDVCQAFMREKIQLLQREYPGIPVFLFSRASMYTDTSRRNSYGVVFSGETETSPEQYVRRFNNEFVTTVCGIAETNPTFIVRPIPDMPFNVNKGLHVQSRFGMSSSDIVFPVDSYLAQNATYLDAVRIAESTCGVRSLDPLPYLCPEGMCMGSKGGRPLYFDDNHLVDFGNEQLKGLFKGVF